MMATSKTFIRQLSDVRMEDVGSVGGKNASLGEMLGTLGAQGVAVPEGFAVTVAAYHAFVAHNALDEAIRAKTTCLKEDLSNLQEVAAEIQEAFARGEVPSELRNATEGAYADLCRAASTEVLPVAVRSSATAEDLPDASFAGQQATYLYVYGPEQLLRRLRDCFASLFTARAIAYRIENGFDHRDVALSVGVQRMVRSDSGAAGVAFSIDTETGNPDVTVITGAWGLGEAVVQGAVDPDEFQVFKPLLGAGRAPIIGKTRGAKHLKMVPRVDEAGTEIDTLEVPESDRRRWCLDDAAILTLAEWIGRIERHYGRPMDIEWAQDGETGELFIVQARPETVSSRRHSSRICRYDVSETGPLLVEGVAVGAGAAAGQARLLSSPDEQDAFQDGEVLVTRMTDPDWLPVMRRASAIVTERGGRTSHAAIVSRELGLPAVTGAPGAMAAIENGGAVTVSCCEGAVGRVYQGRAKIASEDVDLTALPTTRTAVMLNLADPSRAQSWWQLPADGVGLARMEFIVANHVRAHPLALLDPARLEDVEARGEVEALIDGYPDGEAYFIDRLARGIASIAATVWPKPVLVRTSDFKTNEYADLLGGAQFEPQEENPMLGWRGVSRYLHPDYAEAFAMECKALHRVRREFGFTNVNIMLPFCRTPEQGREALDVMACHGLERQREGLEVYVMCEVPSNVFLVDEFCRDFDGFSIGSNDLTQLVLGVERDSERLAEIFDEQDPAVRSAIRTVIERAHSRGRKVGLCGQGPSDDPNIARFLVTCGIDSVSVVPDSFAGVKQTIAEIEEAGGLGVFGPEESTPAVAPAASPTG